MRLLIATTNPGKIREFREMLDLTDFEFTDLTEHRALAPIPETGRTFRANACLKAAGYARELNAWALADDSGLCVDALNGAPGVHTARWAQMHDAGAGDAHNNSLLLQQLESFPDDQRTARFVCVLALADPQGRVMLTTMDWVQGRILREPRGGNGFGYDPLFFVESQGRTSAELSGPEKHAISHRGKALRRLKNLMEGYRSDLKAVGR